MKHTRVRACLRGTFKNARYSIRSGIGVAGRRNRIPLLSCPQEHEGKYNHTRKHPAPVWTCTRGNTTRDGKHATVDTGFTRGIPRLSPGDESRGAPPKKHRRRSQTPTHTHTPARCKPTKKQRPSRSPRRTTSPRRCRHAHAGTARAQGSSSGENSGGCGGGGGASLSIMMPTPMAWTMLRCMPLSTNAR